MINFTKLEYQNVEDEGYLNQIKRSVSVPVLFCGISPVFQQKFYYLIFALKEDGCKKFEET